MQSMGYSGFFGSALSVPNMVPRNKHAAWRGLPVSIFLLSTLVGSVGRALGWKDCSISPLDEWKEATERIPAMRMREQFDRRYTCTTSEEGSFMAANYYFDSPCLAKRFFFPPDVHECLKGRRVIFLGDSLSIQQADSLVGMLGWSPEWLPKDSPRSGKKGVNEDGTTFFTLVDCWHPSDHHIRGVERCYDAFARDFPPPDAGSYDSGKLQLRADTHEMPEASHNHHHTRDRLRGRRASEEKEGGGAGEKNGDAQDAETPEEDDEDDSVDDNSTSVHARMVCRPQGEDWLSIALRDYNETRASDVFVINFGAHYRAYEDEAFEHDVSALLNDMAKLGETATVVWREISPVHFPGHNGSYDAFEELDLGNTACCTGTPPKILDRNLWVDNYLQDNNLSDRVKVLRIYDMSYPRGSAHHTCHVAPPSTMDQTGAEGDYCHSNYKIDCTHWSETGVVEEWNALMLNHLCPVE